MRTRFLLAIERGIGVRVARRRLEQAILFGCGAALSALLPQLPQLSQGASRSPSPAQSVQFTVVAVALVGVALSGIYYQRKITRRLQSLLRGRHTIAWSVEEPAPGPHGPGRDSGRVYHEIARLVDGARRQVLILTDASAQSPLGDSPARQAHLTALDQATHRHMDDGGNDDDEEENDEDDDGDDDDNRGPGGFTYVRIIQIPPEQAGKPMPDYLGTANTDHCRKMLTYRHSLDIKRRTDGISPKVHVAVLHMQIERLASLVIVDDYVVILTNALDHEGQPYIASALIMRDHTKRMVRFYENYFKRLRQDATPLTESDLR